MADRDSTLGLWLLWRLEGQSTLSCQAYGAYSQPPALGRRCLQIMSWCQSTLQGSGQLLRALGLPGLSTGSSCPWPAVYRWPLMGCPELPLADAKTEGFGVFRSLDSLISLFLHLLAIISACQYLWRSVLCFSSLFPLCLLHGSSFSSQGAGALRVELLQSWGQRNVCAACSQGGSLQMKINGIQFQNMLTCISVTHPWLTSGR